MNHDEAIDLFVIWLKDKERSEATIREYVYNIRSYLAFLEPKSFSQATKIDVMRYLTGERERGNSVATRNRKLMAIRTFYKALKDLEAIDMDNPAQEIEAGKGVRNKVPTYLEKNALNTFFSAIPHNQYELRNKAIFMLMASGGLRVGEIHNLNTSSLNREYPQGVQVFGKGKKTRYVPLSPSLFQMLLLVEKNRENVKPDLDNRNALFVSRHGTRLTTRRIQQIAQEVFDRLKQTEGFEHLRDTPLTSHKLRHTFGTSLIRAGVDIRTIQELMGHESLNTTEIYTHVADEQKEVAIQKLDDYYSENE